MASRIDDRSGKPHRADDKGWLRRHLGWAIVAKLALIAMLYALFFSPASRPAIDGDAVEQRLHMPSR